MYEIILGRSSSDRKKFDKAGTILLGKHYVTMERNKVLANPIYLDVNKPHSILVAGKRGSGKSYTLGVIAEGIANLAPEIKSNLTTILFDTMGIYWTMKYPNFKDGDLLDKYNLKPSAMEPTIYVPIGKFDEFNDRGIPVDKAFAIKPSQVSFEQWCEIFGIEILSEEGLLLERVLEVQEDDFTLEKLMDTIKSDKDSNDKEKLILKNRFSFVKKWGLFDVNGTDLNELLDGGKMIIIDLSAYSQMEGGEKIKALVIGFIATHALKTRMDARKYEELQILKESSLFAEHESKIPLLQLIIDEAHEFLPREGKTIASYPLIQILREGRQPGISTIFATQQPGKIHTDVMTQSDIVISHRVTSKFDIDALNEMMQSYATSDLQKYIENLPREQGVGIVLDDTNEKIYPMRIRPRFSWHGGEDPNAIRGKILSNFSSTIGSDDKNLK